MARRIRIYLLGVLLGVGISYFYFGANGDRDLDVWTPNSRILEEIRNCELNYSQNVHCLFSCDSMIKNQFNYSLLEGDVDIGASNHRSMPEEYIIYSEDDILKIKIQKTESVAYVSSIETELDKKCNCN